MLKYESILNQPLFAIGKIPQGFPWNIDDALINDLFNEIQFFCFRLNCLINFDMHGLHSALLLVLIC